MATLSAAEQAALRAHTQRNAQDDDDTMVRTIDDNRTTDLGARRGAKKAAMSTEQALNLPRTITFGDTELSIKAFAVDRAADIQNLIWESTPTVVLSAALSQGSGVDAEQAARLFYQLDTEASALIEAGREPDAYNLWRLRWRNAHLSADQLTAPIAAILTAIAVDKAENPLDIEEATALVDGRRLSLIDVIELVQTFFDINSGFPGDIRSRF